MNQSFLLEVKRYVGFGEADVRTLVELAPLLERHAHAVIEVFYDRILEHPRARQAITGGATQVERLKETLRRWLVELGSGVYDGDYFDRRAAIGRRHVQIELPQVFMVTAHAVVQGELMRILRRELAPDPERLARSVDALGRILAIDLAIMLETYQEDRIEETKRIERRASVAELAAKVNHELRGRLATIKSSAFLLEKQLGASITEPVERHLKKVQFGAERAGAVVAALMNLARELEPDVRPLDLNALARQAAATVTAPSGVTIDLQLAPELPRVPGDAELLESVMANLLQNAIEAQETGGRVVVRTSASPDHVALEVMDEGAGISPVAAARLFEPFFTTKPTRTGLGLALSREIVHAHGGRVIAESRRDRSGAIFRIELGLERPAAAPSEAPGPGSASRGAP